MFLFLLFSNILTWKVCAEAFSVPSQTSGIEYFAEMINGFQ